MGICSSCLGFGRRASDSDPSDSSHLLGDPYQPNQYGSVNPSGSHGGPQPDSEEIRRQRDALERICAQTSESVLPSISLAQANLSPLASKLIDVSQSAYTEEGSKMASEYPRLFNERFPPPKSLGSRPSSSGPDQHEDEAAWLENIIGDTGSSEGSWDRVEQIDSGALTVQFDDALSLDRRSTQGAR